jgi:hypothetical protein
VFTTELPAAAGKGVDQIARQRTAHSPVNERKALLEVNGGDKPRWTITYEEIQEPQEKCSVIDGLALMDMLGIPSIEVLLRLHITWVEESLAQGRTRPVRQVD